MNRVPKCLHRRYEIIDNLARELNVAKLRDQSYSTKEESKPPDHYVWNLNRNDSPSPPNRGGIPVRQDPPSFKVRSFQCYTSRSGNWLERCVLQRQPSANNPIGGGIPPAADETPERIESGGINTVSAEEALRLQEQSVPTEAVTEPATAAAPTSQQAARPEQPASTAASELARALARTRSSLSKMENTSEIKKVPGSQQSLKPPQLHTTANKLEPTIPESVSTKSSTVYRPLIVSETESESKRSLSELRQTSSGSRQSILAEIQNKIEEKKRSSELQQIAAGATPSALSSMNPALISRSKTISADSQRPPAGVPSSKQHVTQSQAHEDKRSASELTLVAKGPPSKLSEITESKWLPAGGRSSKQSDTRVRSDTKRSSTETRRLSAGGRPLSEIQERTESAKLRESLRGSTTAYLAAVEADGPLQKAFENSKQVALFNGECLKKINELMLEQRVLVDEIRRIEYREKEGMKLLQEADDMWTRMEENYKAKLEDVLERKDHLSNQLIEVDKSSKKWQAMKKDLESQIDTVEKTIKGMDDKHRIRMNDVRSLDKQIQNLEITIDASKREMEAIERKLQTKRKHSESVAEAVGQKITQLTQEITEECESKAEKERTQVHYINQNREDLQGLWKSLLQRKLQIEELKVQEQSLRAEIKVLEDTESNWNEQATQKYENLQKEVKRVTDCIAEYRVKCSRCHQCVDTHDMKYTCTDCPRCMRRRECKESGVNCVRDPNDACVCVAVKEKFMENVLENMNAVLQQQIDSDAGVAVKDYVMKCLKHSKNGKLDMNTRKMLKDFILSAVRKHLNSTIVGGAVKTRCEMNKETYETLMRCIEGTAIPEIPMEDKETTKKSPCKHWAGTVECECARGPLECVCAKKVPRTTGPGAQSTVYSVVNYERRKGGHRSFLTKDTDGHGKGSPKEHNSITYTVAGRSPQCCQKAAKFGVMGCVKRHKETADKCESYSSADYTSEKSVSPSLYESCRDSVTDPTRSEIEMNNVTSDFIYTGNRSARRSLKYNKKNLRLSFANNLPKGHESKGTEYKTRDKSVEKHVKKKKSCRHVLQPNTSKKRVIQRAPKTKEDDIIELVRTPSQNQALAFDKNIINELQLKLNQNTDMPVYIRKISKDHYSLRLSGDDSYGYEPVKIRKSLSGTLYLDAPKYVIQPTTSSAPNSVQHNALPSSATDNIYDADHCMKIWKSDSNPRYVDRLSHTTTESDSDKHRGKRYRYNLSDSIIQPNIYNVSIQPDLKKMFLRIIPKRMERKLGCVRLKKRDVTPAEKKYEKSNNFTKSVFNNRMKPKSGCRKEQPVERRYTNQSKAESCKKSLKDIFYNKLFVPPAERTLSGNTFVIDKKGSKNSRNLSSQDVLLNSTLRPKPQRASYINIIRDSRIRTYSSKGSQTTKWPEGLKLITCKNSNDHIKKHLNKADKSVNLPGIHKIYRDIARNTGTNEKVRRRKKAKTMKASSDLILTQGKCYVNKDKTSCLLSITSKALKKTKSGGLNLILDKKSKQKLISDLQGLVRNSKGVVPILNTDDVEIKIQIHKKEHSENDEYVRITSSGNIYVSINKDRVDLNVNKPDLRNKTTKFEKLGNSKKTKEKFYRRKEVDHCVDKVKSPQELLALHHKTSNFIRKHLSTELQTNPSNERRRSNEKDLDSDNFPNINDYLPQKDNNWFGNTNEPYVIEYQKTDSSPGSSEAISKVTSEETSDSKTNSRDGKLKGITNLVKEFFWNNIESLPPQLPTFLRDNNFNTIKP